MTKSGLIVLLCIVLASGCALFDGTEVTPDQPPAEAPAADEGFSIPARNEGPPAQTTIVARRTFTRDDIRLMQLRLREVGFDSGPIDGVAGAKTKSAVVRFQAGCSSASGMIEQWAEAGSQSSPGNMPNRQETQAIQTQLRNAGFNPGPIDGVFGSKTRSLLSQLRMNCPMSSDFVERIDQANVVTSNSMGAVRGPENNPGKSLVSSPVRSEVTRQPTPQPARSQEEVRILQLQLRDAGFDPGPFDGVMGPRTQLALQQFQASQKIHKTKAALVSGVSGQY